VTSVGGLDLSLTATGVALPDGTFATISTSAKGMPRLAAIRDAVLGMVGMADVVVVEGYSMGSGRAGGTTHAHGLGELGGVVRLALYEAGIPHVDVAPARLKKWATGRGNADKDAVLVKAARNWDVQDNNQADAAWLRHMGVCRYLDIEITEAQRQILGQVDWPTLGSTDPWGPTPKEKS
jgi:crossover junction endodeoxyribonuclease RuvC